MNYERLRWVVLSYALFQAAKLVFMGTGIENPETWAALLVVGGWSVLLIRFLYRHLMQSRWIYKLRRAQGQVTDKIARPFGAPGFLERTYLHIRPPRWCRQSDDELMLIYRDQKKLLFEGEVVLGLLVQANALLFRKGFADAPANVIYTADMSVENPVVKLREIAERLFSLKGTKPDDALERKFAGMISYEYSRDFRVTLPESLAQGLDATYTTIMVHRKHLPEGYITNDFFPLLIHQESRAAMILPARYWSEELLSAWGVS